MNTSLLANKDFLAGLIYILIGCIALFVAMDYPRGTAVRMGPGYFPTVLSGILILFGLYILQRGLRTKVKLEGRWGWKPLLFIATGILVFGYLMEHMGLFPALIAMFFICAAGGHEFKFREVVILAIACCAMAWAIFIKALGLPYQLFVPPGF